MLTPSRSVSKRIQDVADFSWMVIHSMDQGHQRIELQKLAALGEMVWPGGGGDEILRLVQTIKSGETFSVDDLIRRPPS
jgi:hypothetical protein